MNARLIATAIGGVLSALLILALVGACNTPAGWVLCEDGAPVESINWSDARKALVECDDGRPPRGLIASVGGTSTRATRTVTPSTPAGQGLPAAQTVGGSSPSPTDQPAQPAPAASPQVSATPVPASSPSPTPTPEPASLPIVSELVVCDARVDCGDNPTRGEWDSVVACLRVTIEGRPLQTVLVATADQQPPGGPASPAVIARSDPVQSNGTFGCHILRAVDRPLSRGEYWLWVVYGMTPLNRTGFFLGR